MRLSSFFAATCGLALECMLFASTAQAQQPQQPPPVKPADPSTPARSSAQFTLRRDAAGGQEGQEARSRARGGDCAGALPLFDIAIENTIEPTLRRDRGLCHEKLGHPFPAIEDYRAYVLGAPNASDAEQIQKRLNALEGQPASSSKPAASTTTGTGASANASASMSGSSSSSSSASTDGDGKQQDFDYLAQQEKLSDAAEGSPLRYGKGIVLGLMVLMPRFFVGDGASKKLAYGAGLALRYSTGRTLSLISEVGFSGIGEAGASSSQSGPLLFGGVELRLPVSRYAGDHVLLRGGLGYERPVVSGTRAINNFLLGRFGVGFRHVFGPSIALEALFDGGPLLVIPENGDSRANGVLGGSVAFVVGF